MPAPLLELHRSPSLLLHYPMSARFVPATKGDQLGKPVLQRLLKVAHLASFVAPATHR
jgi:hypothetical protein